MRFSSTFAKYLKDGIGMLFQTSVYYFIFIKSCFRNLRYIILLVAFSFLPFFGQARIDSTYIAPFPQEFSIGAYTYKQFTVVTHQINEDESITYMPNSPVGMGLSVSYKNFSLAGGLSFPFMRSSELGDTKALDLQYHYYGRRIILDFFFERYKGFYTQEIKDNEQLVTLYPDIRIVQYGLHGQYIFNHKKFSYRAAFSQSERQLKSAGSFQLGGGFYFNQIVSDSTLAMNQRNRLDNYQFSLSGGYIYTFVFTKSFHASIGLSMGLSLGTEDIRNIKKLEVSPNIFPRISMGYTGKSWSFGVSFVMNQMYVAYREELNMTFDTGYAEMIFIKRINTAPAFLKKVKILN